MVKAQGATEYLVLLAVVLIVALVSVALLGFFPGMASDAQITQSKAYWQSASPIQIIESDARAYTTPGYNSLYIRIRNAGAYPIRITRLTAGNGQMISQISVAGSTANMTDYFYMAPGEEKYFGWSNPWPTLPADRAVAILASGGSSGGIYFYAAQSLCQISNSTPGMLSISGFGFEYIEYIEGQQITKRQVGSKPLLVKCGPPFQN